MKYVQAMVLMLSLLMVTSPVLANVADSAEQSPVFVQGERVLPDADIDLDEWNNGSRIESSYRNFDLNRRLAVGLQADQEEEGDVETVTPEGEEEVMAGVDKKNPGRALLLSAILPGAGELYAGKHWRAAGFFALELASWVGAVYYAQQGQDKEDEFEAFADAFYRENYYRYIEYNAAIDPSYGTSEEGYPDPQDAWETLDWQEKLKYLPGNFTHDLPTERNQQYYENIGKYLTQFGYGWEDYIAGRDEEAIAAEAASWGYEWDGDSPYVNEYIDMRDESNKLLDRSATFFAVIMVNHVASALHAGFTVRAMNKKAEVEPEVGTIWHNNEYVQTAGIRVRF